MNVVIVHYHLNRGGVARVIANHAEAIDSAVTPGDNTRLVVLHGGRKEGWTRDALTQSHNANSSIEVCPTLDYDDGSGSSARLVDDLPERLAELNLAPEDTVVHVHNHALGKNHGLPQAIGRLAEAGYGLLLQIHDFVEDYRPANYRRVVETLGPEPWRRLYPLGPRVHYGVLNERDRTVLASAGVPSERLHLVPNPVLSFEDVPPKEAAREKLERLFRINRDVSFLLYPVRCIRRKNIGEALLLSIMAPTKTVVGFTLAPLNPVERDFYTPWREAAETRRVPCRFEVGAPGAMTFSEAMAAADGTITSSVAEGFGMAFLECWQLGLSLAGRNLPDITRDFREHGIVFPNTYSTLDVPVRWLDRETLQQKLVAKFRKTLRAYGKPETNRDMAVLSRKWAGESVDFGDLDEQLQLQLINVLRHDAARRDDLISINPILGQCLLPSRRAAADHIDENARIAGESYGKEALGRRLVALYGTILEESPTDNVDVLPHGEQILDSFLKPERFRLLRA